MTNKQILHKKRRKLILYADAHWMEEDDSGNFIMSFGNGKTGTWGGPVKDFEEVHTTLIMPKRGVNQLVEALQEVLVQES